MVATAFGKPEVVELIKVCRALLPSLPPLSSSYLFHLSSSFCSSSPTSISSFSSSAAWARRLEGNEWEAQARSAGGCLSPRPSSCRPNSPSLDHRALPWPCRVRRRVENGHFREKEPRRGERGAPKERQGQTAAVQAVLDGTGSNDFTPLKAAALGGHTDIMEALLQEDGQSVTTEAALARACV